MSGAAPDFEARLARLEALLDGFDRLAVAFSGGVDSCVVLAAAHARLGDRVLAVTGVSPSLAARQLETARAFTASRGIAHRLLHTQEGRDERYVANASDRCFWCKHELYGRMRADLGPSWPDIADGNNADDVGDHRPGMQAARRHGVHSPLIAAGFSKADVRELARRMGLETAEAPAAPCLSSRVPYGSPVTPAVLAAVEAGEEAARAFGLVEYRLRHLGDSGRLELAAADLAAIAARGDAGRLCAAVARAAGLARVHVDPRPLRSGRLNEEAGVRPRPAGS